MTKSSHNTFSYKLYPVVFYVHECNTNQMSSTFTMWTGRQFSNKNWEPMSQCPVTQGCIMNWQTQYKPQLN